MINNKKQIDIAKEQVSSKARYLFSPNDEFWRLDKNVNLHVSSVCNRLENSMAKSYVKVLAYYACNYSASYPKHINTVFLHMLKTTEASTITDIVLINYRAKLTRVNESNLIAVRAFIRKWHDLGYQGISDDIIDLLAG